KKKKKNVKRIKKEKKKSEEIWKKRDLFPENLERVRWPHARTIDKVEVAKQKLLYSFNIPALGEQWIANANRSHHRNSTVRQFPITCITKAKVCRRKSKFAKKKKKNNKSDRVGFVKEKKVVCGIVELGYFSSRPGKAQFRHS
ncbi:hypothetical protein RFI_37217, partial [Reticulomyxa filosa]